MLPSHVASYQVLGKRQLGLSTHSHFSDKAVQLGLDSYKQEALCHHFFCDAFAAHNALADAEALKKLVEQVQFAQELLVKHSFTLEFVLELQRFSAAKKSMMTSWENLVFCLNQWLKKLLVLA